MTDLQQHSAIRSRLYLGGKFISRDPLPIQLSTKRFQSVTATSNLGVRIDRPFTVAGMPNIRSRREFVLPWSDVREPGILEHLDILAATGQPFPFGLWKQEYDVFDGDGSAQTFYLQRRQLLPAVDPATMYPDFPTRVVLYDKSYLDPTATPVELTVVPQTSSSIDSGNPSTGEAWIETDGSQEGNVWRSKMRLGDVPPDASDCLVAIYLPLYTVVVDQEQPRTYSQSLVEPRTLKLVEFG